MAKILNLTIFAALLTLQVNSSLASSGGSMTMGSAMGSEESRSPEELAKRDYNSGIRSIKKAKDYDADAAKASSEEKKNKALSKSHDAYMKALSQFQDAVDRQPGMYEAWNDLGFANRHLGNYDAALQAYARALELNPSYPEAVEYRGEAYLGLNRTDAAKDAYMTLFRDARPLAAELLAAMHQWIEDRRKDAHGVDPAALQEFSSWVEERATLASQTSAMAIGAPAHAWK
jgi:tetratricopeptide (TPR) repeat protein